VIVDAHTHRYPEEVLEDPESFAQLHKEWHWLELVSPDNNKSLQGWSTREKMIADMDKSDVGRAVLLGWYWENPETCELQNQWCSQWIARDPERFIGFFSLHPELQNSVESLKKSKDLGFIGIGECHPWLQGASIQNANWMKCMEFAAAECWPVTFHVTEPVGHDYPGRVQTPFEEFLWLARQLPELKIILAHAGGLFPFYELNPKIRPELKNVHYDLAACPLLYDPEIYRKLIDVVGVEKILWGTDYPLRIFPATQKEPDFISFKNLVLKEAELSESERDAIFGNNLLALLPC
jgi:predicted TIM-barrel fold metal-dependent hydrolase